MTAVGANKDFTNISREALAERLAEQRGLVRDLTTVLEKRNAEIRRQRAALMRLANEVRATMSIAEAAVREAAGNTNYQCLMDAEGEARIALAANGEGARPQAQEGEQT